ncbi:serine/threonine-protein kinase [archaeon]|nr:serine/threonine-protein kinase [archaeon]
MEVNDLIKKRYRILELLGEGGMAFVFKAKDEQLERNVAIKTLKPIYISDSNFVSRFKREAQTAANLNHPNIVQIFDWGVEENEPYFVMEYVEGTTLSSVLAKNKRVNISDALYIGSQVSAALHEAHENNLVHRDIKPGNIMITPGGKIKVTDFGIVSIQDEDSDITKSGTILGTANYISPEQAQGLPVSKQSDLYSLGVVLYELISGKTPFDGDTPISIATKHLTEKPKPISELINDIPAGVEKIILKLLNKKQINRYKSAEDLRAALNQQKSYLQLNKTKENLISLTNPRVKLRFTLPALAISIFLVIGSINVLGNIFDNLPVDGGSPSLIEIPDLTGSLQAQALNDLQSIGFQVAIENSADPTIPEGFVIKTQPVANTITNPDTLVTIIVSVGPEAFPVPYVVDLEADRGRYVITESGFNIGQILEVNDDNTPRGFIISQNPVAGTKLGPNSNIDIVVSIGPSLIEISDLSRKSTVDAVQILDTLGINYEFVEEYSENVTVGLISHTEPPAGELITIDEVIKVVISLGLKIEVPNLIGYTYSEAANILQNLGLLPSASGDTGGRVTEQSPSEGEFLDPEGFVEISFGN